MPRILTVLALSFLLGPLCTGAPTRSELLEFDLPEGWIPFEILKPATFAAKAPDNSKVVIVAIAPFFPAPTSFADPDVADLLRGVSDSASKIVATSDLTIDGHPARRCVLDAKTPSGPVQMKTYFVIHSPGVYTVNLAGFDDAEEKKFVATLHAVPGTVTATENLRRMSPAEKARLFGEITFYVVLAAVVVFLIVRSLKKKPTAALPR